MPTARKLSIGVISYRFDGMLDRTITSLGSLPDEVEVIVQVADAVENDHQQFSLKYDSIIRQDQIRVLPTGDSGIFNAMNRVRLAAKGEYLWFIDAGDGLLPGLALDRFLTVLTEPRSYGFRTVQIHAQDAFIRPASRHINPQPGQIGHVGSIYHRSAFRVIAYDENQPISSDQDFTEKCFRHSGWHYIPEIISIFQLDGVSSRYWFRDFKAYANASLSLKVKFLIKMTLKWLVGPKLLHRILLFRKCDRIDSQDAMPRHLE